MQAPAESRSNKRNSAGKSRRGRCPPGFHGCLQWPRSGQGEGIPVCTNLHVYTCALALPPYRSQEEIITLILLTSVYSLLDDMHWILKDAGSSLRAGVGCQVEVPAL